jgi:hypothetical protein
MVSHFSKLFHFNNSSHNCYTTGSYTVGIFQITKECNEELQWLKILVDQTIENLKSFTTPYGNVKLKYSFCSDYSFASHVLGLKGANSNHPCFKCTIKKDEMYKCEGEFDKRSFDYQTNVLNVRNS